MLKNSSKPIIDLFPTHNLTMTQLKTQLTLAEFLALPEGDIIYELIDGEAIPKFKQDQMSAVASTGGTPRTCHNGGNPRMAVLSATRCLPKFFHSSVTGALFVLLSSWAKEKGRVVIEWAIKLTRNQKDWVPVPDLTYISYHRLPKNWLQDEACPVAPELVIEIISPGQTFGEMTEKATDYIQAGVLRVWIIDTQAKTFTIFYPDSLPQTKRNQDNLEDSLFAGLEITPEQIFQQAGII